MAEKNISFTGRSVSSTDQYYIIPKKLLVKIRILWPFLWFVPRHCYQYVLWSMSYWFSLTMLQVHPIIHWFSVEH